MPKLHGLTLSQTGSHDVAWSEITTADGSEPVSGVGYQLYWTMPYTSILDGETGLSYSFPANSTAIAEDRELQAWGSLTDYDDSDSSYLNYTLADLQPPTGLSRTGNVLSWTEPTKSDIPSLSIANDFLPGGQTLTYDILVDATPYATSVSGSSYDTTSDPIASGASVTIIAKSVGFNDSAESSAFTWASVANLGGTNTGTVVKGAATTTTAGTLTITDPDSGQAQYQTRSTTGTYGTFTLGTTGAWTYTLNNSDADVVALTTGQVVSDVFLATSNDGTASQNVTITVRESPTSSTADADAMLTAMTI